MIESGGDGEGKQKGKIHLIQPVQYLVQCLPLSVHTLPFRPLVAALQHKRTELPEWQGLAYSWN